MQVISETLHYRDCPLAASLNGVAARAGYNQTGKRNFGLCRAETGYRGFHISTPSFYSLTFRLQYIHQIVGRHGVCVTVCDSVCVCVRACLL